jgi:hypothetical protein
MREGTYGMASVRAKRGLGVNTQFCIPSMLEVHTNWRL